jgi:hypothetical protein
MREIRTSGVARGRGAFGRPSLLDWLRGLKFGCTGRLQPQPHLPKGENPPGIEEEELTTEPRSHGEEDASGRLVYP